MQCTLKSASAITLAFVECQGKFGRLKHVERSIYKDLVLLLQENRYLKDAELRKKGEESFLGDELVYGGCKGEMKNSIHYRECRYFKTPDEACCRYYFVTICYGDYVEEVLQELSLEPTDIIVMNSCLWDVHRHGKKGIEQYEENLEKLVASLRRLLPDCLFLWLTTPPVDIKSKGGFLMRPGQDLVRINEVRYCNQIAREVFSSANETDRRFRIVDLGYVFQYFEHHRASDGVHWNEKAHRRISNLILEEVAKAFNMEVPRILPAPYETPQLPNPPQPPHNMYNEMNMNHNDSYQGMPNNYDYNGHPHNEWQYENNMPMPYERPPGPRGFPFQPPQMPPPHPFGPMDYMRPSFMDNGGYPEGIRDLDDLGDARRQVEERLRNRQYSEPDLLNTKEKNYRFGVASDQLAVSSLKRKLSESESQSSSKVTIIEGDEGNMKKLVKLGDGTTLHSVMTDKEKEDYKKKQEKLRQEKENQERAEKLRKEMEEKKKAELEEQEKKRKQEEQRKAEEEKFKTLKNVDLSGLPTVSEVPDEKRSISETNMKVTTTKSKVSNFANKLLSFIKNPISKTKDKLQKTELIDVPNNLAKYQNIPNFNPTEPQIPTKAENKENMQLSNPFPKSSFEVLSGADASSDINNTKNNAANIPPKKVDTLALLSMPSPFATTKTISKSTESIESIEYTEPPPPGTEDITEELMHLPQLPGSLIPPTKPTSPVAKPHSPVPDAVSMSIVNDKVESVFEIKNEVKSEIDIKTDIDKEEYSDYDHSDEAKEPEIPGMEVSDVKLLDEEKPKDNVLSKVEKTAVTIAEEKPAKKIVKNEKRENDDSKVEADQPKKKIKVEETESELDVSQSSESFVQDTPSKKKKKKVKNPNETKEERAARRKLKREKKEQIRKQKEKARLAKEQAEKEKSQRESKEASKIKVVDAGQWSKPFSHSNYNPRQRSATWTQLYQPSYNKANNTPVYKQQLIVNQAGGINAATYVVNPYHTVNQQAFKKQQEQLIEQQRQQQLLQQQIAQQQLLQQQSLLLRQQQTKAGQSDDKSTSQSAISNITPSTQTPQLYVDEYGQTYTLEEETFLIGPSGEMQNISSGLAVGNNLLQQQQQQQSQHQQGVQQQYSLIYQQQHATRFL